MDLRELINARTDWMEPTAHAIKWRRKIVMHMSTRELREFIEATKVYFYGMTGLRDEFALPLRIEMSQASKVTSRRRPDRLLDLVESTTGSDTISSRQRFEALRKFDLSLILAEVERREPELSVLDDLDALLDMLEQDIFVGSKKIVAWSYHSANKQMHVQEMRIGRSQRMDTYTLSHPKEPLIERMHELTVRLLANGSYALLLDRCKGTFRTLLKMIRQLFDPKRTASFNKVLDRRGIKQVYPCSSSLYDAVELHSKIIKTAGGKFVVQHDNVTNDSKKDSDNTESSQKYKALDAKVEIAGVVFEMVFQTFSDFFTSELAVDDTNHDLYALKQALKHFFQLFWPREMFGINWSDAGLQKAIFDWKAGNVRWGRGWRDPRSEHVSGSFTAIKV